MSKPTNKRPAVERPSYRQRAACARDAAGRFIRRSNPGQPQPASLPRESGAESVADAFQAGAALPQDPGRGHPEQSGRAGAAGGPAPRREQDMGRHETFENAAPITGQVPPRASDGRVSRGKRKPTDWHSPPPGFMASPAVEPTSFACIEQGIRIEANRLLGIALAEQRRRQTAGIEGHSMPWDAEDEARTRKALHLDALAAIACPGSIDVAGIRYVPESQYEQAIREHRLIAGGIHHDDGTVTYLDAAGASWRKSTAQWIAFVAMQLDHRVRAEMARQRMSYCDMTSAEIEAHEARMLRDLRADAVADLAFRHLRAFNAADALRTGAEPVDDEMRARGDADLLGLAPRWREASEQYGRAVAVYLATCDAAKPTSPGQAPAGAGSEWQAWRDRVDAWSAENGIDDAEGAMNGALDDLGEIEDRIAGLSAASLAGLKLKARVAQRLDDIDIGWPNGLGEGLVRDILALAEPQPRPVAPDLTGLFDFGAATLTELLYLRELADLVGSTAYALAWSGRGRIPHERDKPNAVGRFMQELGDALTDVESQAEQEARQRQPSNHDERETRLAVFADAVIRNDDPDEIAAFASELTAHAAALKEGR